MQNFEVKNMTFEEVDFLLQAENISHAKELLTAKFEYYRPENYTITVTENYKKFFDTYHSCIAEVLTLTKEERTAVFPDWDQKDKYQAVYVFGFSRVYFFDNAGQYIKRIGVGKLENYYHWKF